MSESDDQIATRPRRRFALLGVAAVVVVVAAIAIPLSVHSSHRIYDRDQAAQSAALESIGETAPDWQAYEAAARSSCELDKSAFSLEVASLADQGNVDALRITVRYTCPWRSGEIDRALDGAADARRACAISPAARTAAQQDMAEALDC